MKVFVLLSLVLIAGLSRAQQPSIIPQPVSIQTRAGVFQITARTVIAANDEEDRTAARLFNDYLQSIYGWKLDIDHHEGKNYIRLVTKKFIRAPDKDAYSLTVDKNGITISGDTYAGTFYGLQTLIQLLPVDQNKKTTLPIP